MAQAEQDLDPQEIQRAVWRIDRALKAGREPLALDIKIVGEARVQQIRERRAAKAAPTPVRPQESLQQAQQPSPRYQTTGSPRPITDRGSYEGDGSDAKIKKLPVGRERDWYVFFNERFGPLVVLVLWLFMAELSQAQFYAPSPQECHSLAEPMSRLMPRIESLFNVPKWAHDALVSADDVVTLGMVLMSYLSRIGVLEKMLPWYTGEASQVKAQVNSGEPIQFNPATAGIPNAGVPQGDRGLQAPVTEGTNGYRGDLSGVIGIGAQYIPG